MELLDAALASGPAEWVWAREEAAQVGWELAEWVLVASERVA
jgi:hypothetical protein